MSAFPQDRTFIIVEAGVTNYGDPELARRQIDAAVDAGADAVKFQAWKTESLVSRPVAARVAAELGRDWFGRMQERELSFDDLRALGTYAAERGIPFFATAHDHDSLELLVELDVPYVKVGSGEASNWRFLERIGSLGKPVLISFGLQDDDEARRAVDTLGAAGADEIVALHTVSLYPTPAAHAQLDRIARLRDALGVPVGISDHTVGFHVVLAAIVLGATVVEKHLTFDKADPRSLDNAGALEPDEFAELVRQAREVEAALRGGDGEEHARAIEASRDWALQAVVAARDLEPGRVLVDDDLAFKRPLRGGIPVSQVDRVLGRTLRRPVAGDEQILPDDLD